MHLRSEEASLSGSIRQSTTQSLDGLRTSCAAAMPRSSSFSEAPLRSLAVCREQSLAKAAPDAIRRGRLDGNGRDDRIRTCQRAGSGA